MLNKSIAFGLLAAGLMIAPTAAFAQQSQSVDQFTEQNGAATNGSSTVQTSTTNSRQVQNQNTSNPRYRRYGNGYGSTRPARQSQDAVQTTKQNGASVDGASTDQLSNTNNDQRQNIRRGR
ncbi:hypothetical protein BZZ01_12530 [Nostocales cyanobacterium HT-58-2]|nr:hypothetical protein BZZ01_12510 [Nostocales cyanobacterium HT-58-2]ARV59341.1 hypothetical protein BZZ01_12515 [Nostocales cyanobacterium HT-58-2]ARV59343.1 hypothetical protein BZZ01_12525 [Nostocales cyanobacterium HT-58-2]ARV59344.1 hypothetical protein BZZ01_12530 [Nostocales cyanobacterium HT-58-2]